uniref:NADH dehydrogenase subunit 6 n=1 Tax=Proasellus ortizi TaxID=1282012 RepID=A0A485M7E2_9CRUS|nr:NADH dehydrogenase subunit 6 [Proasellus ortizi]
MLILLASLGSLFLASSTPHILIFSLLASTLVAVVILSLLNSFPWLSYILFLVFLGGILILFTYISSLSTNHLFSEVKLKIVIFLTSMFVLLTLTNNPPSQATSWGPNNYDADMFMKELLAPTFYPLYLYLFSYLLITLLYVVMIMKVYYAPLRSSVS